MLDLDVNLQHLVDANGLVELSFVRTSTASKAKAFGALARAKENAEESLWEDWSWEISETDWFGAFPNPAQVADQIECN